MAREYPKTLRAVKAEEGQSWAVAFALAAEIETLASGTAKAGEYDRCAKFLEERGFERHPSTLRMYGDMAKWALSAGSAASREFADFSIRMAQVAMQAGLSPAEALTELRKAKRNDEHLRPFHTRLTGKAWSPNATHDTHVGGERPSRPTRTGQDIRQAVKAADDDDVDVTIEDKLGLLKDLMSDKKLVRAYREQEAPDVSESDAKAAVAFAAAITAPLAQSAAHLQLPMWLDQLKAITNELSQWEFTEDEVRQLRRAITKLSNEIEVQEFRLGLTEATP